MAATSELKAKIGAVVHGKGKLPEILGKRVAEMYDNIEKTIYGYADTLGNEITSHARDWMELSYPSGRDYAYVDTKGNTLFEWTASAAGEIPAIVSHTLIDSLECRPIYAESIDTLMSFHLGVWSRRLGGRYPTIAFRGASKKHPIGRLIVKFGTGSQTPVYKYAEYLEDESSRSYRPFLDDAFKYALHMVHGEFEKVLKEAMQHSMRRKSVPVHFRFYAKKG